MLKLLALHVLGLEMEQQDGYDLEEKEDGHGVDQWW